MVGGRIWKLELRPMEIACGGMESDLYYTVERKLVNIRVIV